MYALAVGAGRNDLMYTYEKYLKALPTYGTIPYWGTVNVRPYQWMPLPASMLADEIIKPTISFLNMDHEIIMYRPIDPIKGTFQYQDVITDVYVPIIPPPSSMKPAVSAANQCQRVTL